MGHAPPLPSMALRPSQVESMLTSVCAVYSASTQPVSRSVPLPLPQTLSGPENTVLALAFWQLRLLTLGSRMVNVLPDWVVLSETLPSQAPVPLPTASVTCSWVRRTLPVVASTSTVRRL